jgi:hypothetical protein
MKRLVLPSGIQERINTLLGSQKPAAPAGTLLEWALQQAILDGVKRVTKALVGASASGRVLRGLRIVANGATKIDIQSGLGVTFNGDIVELKFNVTNINLSNSTPGTTNYVYLKYNGLKALDVGVTGGHQANVIGAVATEIVYDEFCSASASEASIKAASGVITVDTDMIDVSSGDYILVGTIKAGDLTGTPVNSGFEDDFNNKKFPGNVEATGTLKAGGALTAGAATLGAINSSGDITTTGKLTSGASGIQTSGGIQFNGDIKPNAGAATGQTATVHVRNSADTGDAVLTFVNGILTAVTP